MISRTDENKKFRLTKMHNIMFLILIIMGQTPKLPEKYFWQISDKKISNKKS